jgi:DNA-binding transcriptional MerR regulator
MTITELAESTGVSKHTLRYYERAGLVPLVGRHPSSGHRLYTPQHQQWIAFVRNLRATGMPIRELRAYASLVSKGDETWPRRKALLAAHRSRIVAMMAVLEEQRKVLDQKLALGCAPSGLRPSAPAANPRVKRVAAPAARR